MAIGPVQLIVLGFSHPEFHGEIITELERLRESDTVRVIDALAVHKDADGEVEVAHLSNLTKDEAIELGSKVGALIGLGIEGEEGMEEGAIAGAEAAADGVHVFSDEEAWDVLEEIPNDSAAALLLIDHQVGTMQWIKTLPLEVVKRHTLALAKTAHLLHIPVVLTSSQEENVQGPLIPELKGILPEAFASRIKRAGIVNAWDDPNFKKAIKATKRKNLIMAGVTTDVCLVFPAISACREGYRVQAVMDASGSPYDISEEMSRRRMEREGTVLTATNTLMAELAQDWSRPEGGQLLQVLFQDVLPRIG